MQSDTGHGTLTLNTLPLWWQKHTPQRILVVGSSNAGKSTFAQGLHLISGLPCFEIDDLAWQPGWQMHDLPILREKVTAVVAQKQWVLVGNYGNTQDISWPEADLVIWLDLPKGLLMGRVLWRTCHRILYKTPVCNGNYESFSRAFLHRDSLILWVWNQYASIRQRYLERLHTRPRDLKPAILQLKSRRDVRQCEAALKDVFQPTIRQKTPPESKCH